MPALAALGADIVSVILAPTCHGWRFDLLLTSNVQTSITKDMSLGCIPYKLYLFIRNIMVCSLSLLEKFGFYMTVFWLFPRVLEGLGNSGGRGW